MDSSLLAVCHVREAAQSLVFISNYVCLHLVSPYINKVCIYAHNHAYMVCLYHCRLVLLLDRPGQLRGCSGSPLLASWLIVQSSVIVPFDLPFVVGRHGKHVGHRFSVVGNKLKLNIMLGSKVDLYTAI